MENSRPKLGYWKIRGLASYLRYMLHYAEVDFEDITYEVGPAPQFSRDVWFNIKPTLDYDFPNLPYFQDGDFKLTESAAIAKYIAHKWAKDLLGTTTQEYANAEMLFEFVGKLKMAVTMPSYTGGEHGDAITCAKLATDCYPHLAKLVDFRSKHGFKWVAGNNLTWIDFYLWEIVDYMKWLSNDAVFEQFPSIKEYHANFLALPQIQKVWGDDEKIMKYPWNNAMAKIGGRDSTIHP